MKQNDKILQKWGSKVEIERRRRILIAIYAYAYEFENESIITDSDFDRLGESLDLELETGNKKMDRFFQNEFDSSTGIWIHRHPNLQRIRQLYFEHFAL